MYNKSWSFKSFIALSYYARSLFKNLHKSNNTGPYFFIKSFILEIFLYHPYTDLLLFLVLFPIKTVLQKNSCANIGIKCECIDKANSK